MKQKPYASGGWVSAWLWVHMVFTIEIENVQPSQLYISRMKLNKVQKFFKKGEQSDLEPIPIKKLDNEMVATDGHTRGFAWFLNGYEELPCVWEDTDLNWEAYRICVRWCKEENITSMKDLSDRIVAPEQYERTWLDRCKIMQNRLAEESGRNRKTESV